MMHVKRIDEIVGSKQRTKKATNESYRNDIQTQIELFTNCVKNESFVVRIVQAEGDTTYKAGDNIDYLDEFVDACKAMTETCSGSMEITTEDNYEYTVYIEDENGEMYARINFLVIYFGNNCVEAVRSFFGAD